MFRFIAPKGFDGFHRLDIVDTYRGKVVLRYTLKMKAKGRALLTWPVIYRPLHEALVEDALATVEVSLGLAPEIVKWSVWVRFLRWVFSGGKAGKQQIAD